MVEYGVIPRFSDYCVGDNGTVWSQKRGDWHQLSPDPAGGREFVILSDGGEKFTFAVSRLVLEVFIGPCPEGMECCHNDGDSTNNCLENLRWDTHRNNEADKRRHGTLHFGERNPKAKLSAEQVCEIRKLASEGVKRSEIAHQFGLSWTCIDYIVKRVNWQSEPGGGGTFGHERGSDRYNATLTEDQVREIRCLAVLGISRRELVLQFGVKYGVIANVIRCNSWRHVT